MLIYLKLFLTSILPVIISIIIYILNKKIKFNNFSQKSINIFIGIIFGIISILGTELGVSVAIADNAVMNVRDASPLIAGLVFSPVSGIIAGFMGGIERWFAIYWGAGTYTRIACSAATIFAGFFGAVLRKYLFDNKRPLWIYGIAIALTTEVFHMLLVFITNMSDVAKAFNVIKHCSPLMIILNCFSVSLSLLLISLIAKDSKQKSAGKKNISQTIQKGLLVCVLLGFVATNSFTILIQTRLSLSDGVKLMQLNIEDIKNEINDTSAANLLKIVQYIKNDYEHLKNPTNKDIEKISIKYLISEFNVIDNKHKIILSTNPDFIDFDMNSGDQSFDFMKSFETGDTVVKPYQPISYNTSLFRKYAGTKLSDGNFLQIGYDAEYFHKDIEQHVLNIVQNRHIGKSGYLLIADSSENILLGKNKAQKNLNDFNLQNIEQTFESGKLIKTKVMNEKCYIFYEKTEGYYIIGIMPSSEMLFSRDISGYISAFMQILIFVSLFILIYYLIKKVVVDNMNKINNSLGNITKGNLNEVVDVRTNYEFASLSDDINRTVDTLKKYIGEAEERIKKDLEFAKSIQSSSLPNNFYPNRSEFNIYARMDTAKEVGGDFYDFYFTHHNTLNFLIADVSGKGIPAAMFMMRAKTLLKSMAENDISIEEVFTQGNHSLCEGNDAEMFVTAWMGQIDLETGLVTFANAGHNPPVVKHKNGQFEYLRSKPGFVLAGMDGIKYKKQEVQLEVGDIIYLYTDGVTEATDKNNELYGEERLLQILNKTEFKDMKELCDCVKSDVDKFVGDAPQFDDITMLGLKYIGKPEKKSISFEEASIDDIPKIIDFVDAELEKMDCPIKAKSQIDIAIDEIYSNISKYSYGNNKGPAKVSLERVQNPEGVVINFVDNGNPYNPLKEEDPDTTLSLDEREIGGLGIYMVKKSMDQCRYTYINNQNCFSIRKNF